MRKLNDILRSAEEHRLPLEEVFEQCKTLPFERFDCPLCKSQFMSRTECFDHIEMEHPIARIERPLFCEVHF